MMMMMNFFFICILASLFALVHGARFLNPLPDGTVVYACAGSSVTLSWPQYQLDQGDQINFVRWYYEDSNNTLVVYYNGTFLMAPGSTGSLQLRDVTTSNSGRYFMEISGVGGNGVQFLLRRYVLLSVDDGLRTADGGLHVTLGEDAVLDNVTGQWSLVLSCGRFTYIGQPAFPMEWVTPSGRVVESSKYEDGNFKLHLTTSSVEGGRYVCRVPTAYTSAACLSNSQATTRLFSVTVDKADARMTLLEAELRSLKENEISLTQQVNAQESEIRDLTREVNAHAEEVDAQESEIRALTQKVNVQETNVDALAATHRADKATLVRMINDVAVPTVAFYAQATSDQHLSYGGRLTFSKIYTNQGNGYSYSNTTGYFTAPVSGTYYFSFQTVNRRDHPYIASINVESERLCYVANGGDIGTIPGITIINTAFCNGIRYLSRGQQAWIEANGESDFQALWTTFAGFLIN